MKTKMYCLTIITILLMCTILDKPSLTYAATESTSSARNTSYVSEIYFANVSNGDKLLVTFTFGYIDGVDVWFANFGHGSSGRTWNESVNSSYANDSVITWATLTSENLTCTCNAWCDIYGQKGH